jgi:hypothetical protein
MLQALVALVTLLAANAQAPRDDDHQYDHPHGYQHNEDGDRDARCVWRGGRRLCDEERH